MKLIALYKQPENPAAFNEAYINTHIPLLNKVPGIQKTELVHITRSIMGDHFFLMTIMHLADEDDRRAAMRSPEMTVAGDNLNTFAEGLVTLLYAD